MTATPEPTTCRAWRDACFDSEAAFGPGSAPGGGHAAECAACADWWRRQARLVVALGDLGRRAAPAELDRLLDSEQLAAARTRAVLEHMRVLHAPAVLERLVREEIDGHPGTTVGRLATDLGRLQAPAALDHAVASAQAPAAGPMPGLRERRDRPRRVSRRRWIGLSGALAAGLLALILLRETGAEPRYRFEVVEIDAARLREQSPFGFRLANGLSGGAAAVQASLGAGAADGGRR